jgi:hypothetical protein
MPTPIEARRWSSGGDGMGKHTIRLRAGWTFSPLEAPGASVPGRGTLPANRGSMPAGRLRWTRRFQRPPRVPGESAVLCLSRMPGIVSVSLNGRPIGPTSPVASEFELELGELLPRNELTIEADPPRDAGEWGEVALVFG